MKKQESPNLLLLLPPDYIYNSRTNRNEVNIMDSTHEVYIDPRLGSGITIHIPADVAIELIKRWYMNDEE